MQRMSKAGIILLTSTVGSWLGALMSGGDWFGWASSILGIVGLAAGYWLAKILDNYIDS